ncbi:MAG: LapA family protein [Actinobacteria bacterium]|nr:LapA family protein [Actinomycetota bacterium]
MRLFKRDEGNEPGLPPDEYQTKLWIQLGALLLGVAYVVGFVVANSDETKVSFVLFSTTTSLIWVILLSLVIGLVGGLLLAQLYRKRQRP